MGNAERRSLADQPASVDHFLDLGGTYAIARGLDHLVAAADEIQESLSVRPHGVPRPDRYLGHDKALRVARRRLEAFRRLLRIVPVAEGDKRAAVHQLARLARFAGRTVLAHDQ